MGILERLGLGGQGGSSIELGEHLPGRKIRPRAGVGASGDQHIGGFDQMGLEISPLWAALRVAGHK